jgi:hypothetical protein
VSFQPAIPLGGYAGWRVFERTIPRQRALFERLPEIRRDAEYFRQNVSRAQTAADLVADSKLLKVALGAFGLAAEIGKKALIRRALEEGTERADAFANRLADPRWRRFSEAFGYGDFGGPRVLLTSFRDEMVMRYLERAFEEGVGAIDVDMRLALNFRREIAAIASGPAVDRSGWFQIMGQPPLRAVLEAALGLPSAVGRLDLDRQKAFFERRAEEVFGARSPRVFADPAKVEQALRRFFAQGGSGASVSGLTGGAAALQLLNPRLLGLVAASVRDWAANAAP